jgi:hypothetical protein
VKSFLALLLLVPGAKASISVLNKPSIYELLSPILTVFLMSSCVALFLFFFWELLQGKESKDTINLLAIIDLVLIEFFLFNSVFDLSWFQHRFFFLPKQPIYEGLPLFLSWPFWFFFVMFQLLVLTYAGFKYRKGASIKSSRKRLKKILFPAAVVFLLLFLLFLVNPPGGGSPFT